MASALAERRATVDQRYRAAHGEAPAEVDDIDSGRLEMGEPLSPGIWNDLEW